MVGTGSSSHDDSPLDHIIPPSVSLIKQPSKELATNKDMIDPALRYGAIALLCTEFFLLFIPLGVLGAAMNWPQSLDEPASVNLPKILEEEASVKSGYFIYMIYSILIGPLGLTLSHVLAGKDQQNSPLLLKMANGFAISSAVLRCLGIIRWLVPMYGLAEVYTNPNTSEELRQAVEVMYDMLNDYAGSVGEILGVGFFASLWILTTAVVMIKDKTFPFWVGGLGIVAGILLGCTILEMFGVELGALLTANVTILHIWWLIIAGILAFRPNLVSGFEDPIRQEETGKGVLKEEDKET